jgi:hypothetical protein
VYNLAGHVTAGGPLLIRDASGAATQVGITSHGPDCATGQADLAYGYYTDVRKYLGAITSWRNGTQIPWPPAGGDGSSGSSSSNVTPAGGTGASTGALAGGSGSGILGTAGGGAGSTADLSSPSPSPALDGSSWYSPDPSTGGGSSWGVPSFDQIMCQIFGC